MGTERDQLKKKHKTGTQHVHTTSTWYLVLRFMLGTAICSKEITAQHDTAQQRRARHGTARRCAALRSYILLS